jgi:hypothetical protein
MPSLLLIGVAAVAHTVETITGFGATVIALSLGAHLVPITALVVALVVVGVLQSSWIVARAWRDIDWRVLLGRIVPVAGVGLVAGVLLRAHLPGSTLRVVLGGFVIAAASLELWRLRRESGQGKLPCVLEITLFLLGGVVHGLFASGGPLIVIGLSRILADKARFRATLSMLWLVLNLVLLATALGQGTLTAETGALLGLLVPGLAIGIAAGEIVHRRIPLLAFRRLVQGCLVVAGVSLVL